MRRTALATALLLASLLAGCTGSKDDATDPYTSLEGYVRDPTGRNATAWPDLPGVTLTILDNGAFQGVFDATAKQFESLTGVKVKLESGDDTVGALQKVLTSKRSEQYDVLWGMDNLVHVRAMGTGALIPYKPQLADRIDPQFVYFGSRPWIATPVDHGYIGLNIDASAFNASVDSLTKVAHYADQLVVQDPRTSGPGLGFLLITVGHFGEDPPYTTANYDWKEYWRDLLRGPDRDRDGESDGCVLVTNTWSEAYEQHFSAGYGVDMGGLGDKPIVVSYTQSPAYEVFFGRDRDNAAMALVAPNTTIQQIQTVAIVNGTTNLQAAQAWVEFTLTDFFQELLPEKDVMYPVVPGIGTAQRTFGSVDPEPGSFEPVRLSLEDLARYRVDSKGKPGPTNLERWVREWTDLVQDTETNCNL